MLTAGVLLASSLLAVRADDPNPPQEQVKAARAKAERLVREKVKIAVPAPGKAALRVPARAGAVELPPAPAFIAANQEPMIQQFIGQFRPMLSAEYHFARTVCELTKEQRKQIARGAEDIIKSAATSYVQWQFNPRGRRSGGPPEPSKLIDDALGAAIKANVTPEQWSRYQEETEQRAAHRKEAAVWNLVAKLDKLLVLSPAQRGQLVETLSAQWDDSWCTSLQMFQNENGYLPPIPDSVIVAHLNERQEKAWKLLPKVQQNWGWGGGFMGAQNAMEDEDLAEARTAAVEAAAAK
jgi:hypothetical protein